MEINTLNGFPSHAIDNSSDKSSTLSLLYFCLQRDLNLCPAFHYSAESIPEEALQESLGAFVNNWCEIIDYLLRINESSADFPFPPSIYQGTQLLIYLTNILSEHPQVLLLASFNNFYSLENSWSNLVHRIKDRDFTDASFSRDQVVLLKETLHDLVKSCPNHITHHAAFTRVQRFLIHTSHIKTTHESPVLPVPNFVATLSLLNALVMDAPDLASQLKNIISSATSTSQITEIDNHLHNSLLEQIREQQIEENINPFLHEFIIQNYLSQLATLRDENNRTKIIRSLVESLRNFQASDVHAYYDIAILCLSSALMQEPRNALSFYMILLLVIQKGINQSSQEMQNDENNHDELFDDLCDYTLSHDRICDPFDTRIRAFPEMMDSASTTPFIFPSSSNSELAPYRGIDSYYPPLPTGESDNLQNLITSPDHVYKAPFAPEPEYVIPTAPLSTVRIELHRLLFITLSLFANSLTHVKEESNSRYDNDVQFFRNNYRLDVFTQEESFIVIPPFETPARLAHFINRFLFGIEASERTEHKLPKNYYQVPLLVTLIDGMISLRLKDLIRDWLNDILNPLQYYTIPKHLAHRAKYLVTQFYLTSVHYTYDSIELANNIRAMLFMECHVSQAVLANAPQPNIKEYSSSSDPIPNSNGSSIQQHSKHPHRSLLHESLSFAIKDGSIVALLNSEVLIHLLTVIVEHYRTYSPQSLVAEASSITSSILSYYTLDDGRFLNTRTGEHLGNIILICLEALRGPFTFPLIPIPGPDMANWLQEFEGAITTPHHSTLLESFSSNLWLLRKDIVALRWIRVSYGHRFPSTINFSTICKSPLFGDLRSLLLLLEGGQYDLALKRYREILISSRLPGKESSVFNPEHLNYLVNLAVSFDTNCPESVMTTVSNILRDQFKNSSNETVFTTLLQLVPAWKGLFLMGAFINNASETTTITKERDRVIVSGNNEAIEELAKSYFKNQQDGIMKVLNTIFVGSMIEIYVDIYKARDASFKQSHLNISYMKRFVEIFRQLVSTCLGHVTKTFPISYEVSRSFNSYIERLCFQFAQLPIAYALRQVYPEMFDNVVHDSEVIIKVLETETNSEWKAFLTEMLGNGPPQEIYYGIP